MKEKGDTKGETMQLKHIITYTGGYSTESKPDNARNILTRRDFFEATPVMLPAQRIV